MCASSCLALFSEASTFLILHTVGTIFEGYTPTPPPFMYDEVDKRKRSPSRYRGCSGAGKLMRFPGGGKGSGQRDRECVCVQKKYQNQHTITLDSQVRFVDRSFFVDARSK